MDYSASRLCAAFLSTALASAAAVALAPADALAGGGAGGGSPDCKDPGVIVTSGSLQRLTASCTTDDTILINNGATFDGRGFTITAVDNGTTPFEGAILQNQGATARVNNVRLATDLSVVACRGGAQRLAGVRFDGASGSITNVRVLSLNRGPDAALGCQEGFGLEIRNFGASPTETRVTVANSTILNYQKSGIIANGDVNVTTNNNTLGESAAQEFLAANTVQYGFGATGQLSNNQIAGNQNRLNDSAEATAVLLFQVPGLLVSNNNIGGNADVGIDVFESPGVTVANNRVIDETVDNSDFDEDIGIFVDTASQPGSRVSGNTIRCYDEPVVIEGQESNPNALGNNTVQPCTQGPPPEPA